VTTEKDAQNLGSLKFEETPVYVAVIDLTVTPEADSEMFSIRRLRPARGRRREILIRATNWVGDAIMALPALHAVRKRFPGAEIAIVGRPYVADIYRDQEICDQLIPYDPRGLNAGFSGRERLAAELRAQKFDVGLLLQNAFDAACWLGALEFRNESAMLATPAAFF